MRPSILGLFAVVAAFSAAGGAAADASITWSACTLGSGTARTQARCGTLVVPTRWQARGSAQADAIGASATTTIGFALLPATAPSPAADPIVLLPGGPGQAGTGAFVPVLGVLGEMRSQRDLLLFDPRGTGRSGAMHCPDTRPLAERLATTAEAEVARLLVCKEEWPHDPASLSTEVFARDLEAIRVALGVPRMNLLGVSYGTRLALAYDHLFPGRARALVLDAVVPPTMAVGRTLPHDATVALRGVDVRCRADAGCAAAVKRPLDVLVAATLARLQAAPERVRIDDASARTGTDLSLSALLYQNAVIGALYASESTALLPVAVAECATGDCTGIGRLLVLLSASTDDTIAAGMQMAVLCREDLSQPVDAGPAPSDKADTPSDVFADLSDTARKSCAAFTHGPPTWPVTPPLAAPSRTPTLLLSGELDPVTPPPRAVDAQAFQARNRSVVIPGGAHGAALKPCGAGLAADLFAHADDDPEVLEHLDVTCAERSVPFPLFVDAMGPSP